MKFLINALCLVRYYFLYASLRMKTENVCTTHGNKHEIVVNRMEGQIVHMGTVRLNSTGVYVQ